MEATMPPLFSMQQSLKIFPLSKELEISSECTEPLWDSTTTIDSSMLTSFLPAHGPYSALTRRALFKKSAQARDQPTKMLPSPIQESISLSKSRRLQSSETWESGLNSTLPTTMWSPQTCMLHSTKLDHRRATSTWLPRSSKSTRWTSTLMNSNWEMLQDRPGTLWLLNWSSQQSELVMLWESDLPQSMRPPPKRRFSTLATSQTLWHS